MNKLPIIIGVIAIIIIVAIVGIIMIHPSTTSSPTSSTPTESSHTSSTTYTTSTTTSKTVSTSVALSVSDINVTGLAESNGVSGQAYLVNVSITNYLSNPLVVDNSEFALKTSNLLCSPKGFGEYSPSFSYILLPGKTLDITVPFVIPAGSTPEYIIFYNSTLSIHVCVGFPTPYQAISVINLHILSNDSKISTSYIGELCISGEKTITLSISSNHQSVPVEVFGLTTNQSFFNIYIKPVCLNPGSTESTTLEIQPKSSTLSYYCNVYVTLLDKETASVKLAGYLINSTALTLLCNLQGYKYVLANVSLSYLANNTFNLKLYDFYIVTNDGNFQNCYTCNKIFFSLYISKLSNYMLSSILMTKGVSVHGLLLFKIPENATPTKIVYEDSLGQIISCVPVYEHNESISYISCVKVKFLTKLNMIYCKTIYINEFEFSGNKCTVTFSIYNPYLAPINVTRIVGVCPKCFAIINSNISNYIIPEEKCGTFEVTFQYPRISYEGELKVLVQITGAHVISINILNYTLDHASACRNYQGNMKYVVYKIQVKYFGPCKMALSPCDFILVTNEGNYTMNINTEDTDLIPSYCFLPFYKYLVTGEVYCTYISFLVPNSSTPIKLVYACKCCMDNVNVTLTPHLVSYVFNVCIKYELPCGKVCCLYHCTIGKYYSPGSIINISFTAYRYNQNLELIGVEPSTYFTLISHGQTEAHCCLKSWIAVKLNNVSVYTSIYIVVKVISPSSATPKFNIPMLPIIDRRMI
ncbi:MAG: hypothetical protein RXR43_15315 [Sulfolobus sp.]